MKRNKDKRVKGRLVTMVLGKYIIFSIILVLLLFILLFCAIWNIGKYQNVPHVSDLAAKFSETQPEDYESIDVERLLGKNGFVQILDKDNKVIYSNNSAREHEQYSDYELGFISSYNNMAMVTVDDYKRDKTHTDRVISALIYDEDGEILKDALYIIDQDLNILYTTDSTNKDRLTRREYNLLTRNNSGRYTLSKCRFTDSKGNLCTLLVYSPRSVGNGLKRIKQAYLFIALIFIAIFALLLMLFSLWISLRIKKPMRLLQEAMVAISSGENDVVLDYQGPKEFVEICDNFNTMSGALQAAEQENLRLQEEKQKMIADISHDLKTPITVIKGYAEAICDGLVPNGEQEKYLQNIYRRASDLDILINEFYEYAKFEHPDNEIQLELVDLCEFTREYFAMRYDEFDIGGYFLEVDIPEIVLPVKISPKYFRRVYDNIISNFFKYTETGSCFFCKIQSEENEIRIILADDGPGFPVEIKESVFEPFITGEKARNGGSGLGLPLARKIVRQLGGEMRFVQIPQKGYSTEFVISFKK